MCELEVSCCSSLASARQCRRQLSHNPRRRPSPTPPSPSPPASLDARIKALAADLEDVKDQNTDLKSEVADLKARMAASKPPTSLNALNPQITAFLNGAMRIDDHARADSRGRRDRRPAVPAHRRVRLPRRGRSVRGRGRRSSSLEDEAGEGFGADLEEGYVVIKRLPILESAPLGLKLKLGRFRAPIGSGNRMHMHDMPWTTRPLPIATLLGTENGEFFESGFDPVGADAEVILPTIIPGAVMELNADVVDGGDIAIADGDARSPRLPRPLQPVLHRRRRARLQPRRVGLLPRAATSARGLVGADASTSGSRSPPASFTASCSAARCSGADRRFRVDGDDDGVPEPVTLQATPMAWYAFAQYQARWHVYLGARYDYAQDINDTQLTTQVAAGYLSYYTSEFLRFRLGYEHRWSDVPARGRHQFVHRRGQRRLRLPPHRTLLGQSLIGVTMRTSSSCHLILARAGDRAGDARAPQEGQRRHHAQRPRRDHPRGRRRHVSASPRWPSRTRIRTRWSPSRRSSSPRRTPACSSSSASDSTSGARR